MSQTNSTHSPANGQSNGQIFKLLADAINEHLPEEAVSELKVREIVAEQVAAAQLPRPIEVKLSDGTSHKLEGTVHHQLEEVLSLVGEGHQNVLMVGPAGSGKRVIPIIPELRPYLEDAYDPEDDRCISRYQTSNTNLRKTMLQILQKAEVQPWPRLFHNLRGSLETDMIELYPAHVVVAWLGNSERTAVKHYLKVKPSHLNEAQAKGVGAIVGVRLSESSVGERNERKADREFSGKVINPAIAPGPEYPRQESNL